MVRAILEDRKTQTRRPVKREFCGPHDEWHELSGIKDPEGKKYFLNQKCPYGQPGDRLWVRETFCMVEVDKFHPGEIPMPIIYRADEERHGGKWMKCHDVRWTPSIFMPRKVSRITLEIVNVRIERIQDITEVECFGEGIRLDVSDPIQMFKLLWNGINDKRDFGWDDNPWVWVVEFKRIENRK
jgi:hypothetical protein